MDSEKFTAHGWTSSVPDGWEDRSMITLVNSADAEEGFATNIVVTKQQTETDVKEFAILQSALMRQELESGGAALQILDERTIEIGGVPSYQRLQRFDAGGGQIIQQVQTFFQSQNEIYVITGTATLKKFDLAIPAFKEFVESFRLA